NLLTQRSSSPIRFRLFCTCHLMWILASSARISRWPTLPVKIRSTAYEIKTLSAGARRFRCAWPKSNSGQGDYHPPCIPAGASCAFDHRSPNDHPTPTRVKCQVFLRVLLLDLYNIDIYRGGVK